MQAQSFVLEIINNFFDRKSPTHKPTVLVIGYGWGGSSFVNSIDERKYNVSVISKRLTRLNQPYMIADLEPSFTAPPPKMELIEDEASSLNISKKTVYGKNASYYYDYLVVAAGSEPNDFGTKGVKEFCQMFKTEEDLESLKTKLNAVEEVTVIGAGPTGIELALKLRSIGKTVKILEASPTILPGFSDNMRKELMSELKNNDIAVTLECKITNIGAQSYTTTEKSFPYNGLLIWTCGQKPVEFVRTHAFLRKPDKTLKVSDSVFAIGDCIQGHGPPTAQNAKQQGSYLANHFNSNFLEQTPYMFKEKGRIIDTPACIYVEISGTLYKFPPFFRFLIKTMTE
jgi:NADPH-dependent 2,4-dienoyl-CoA reductase/sulfur reductase-like enzyme